MRNPWLDIPVEDYEARMSRPSVGQTEMRGDQLERLLRMRSPASAAIVGCADVQSEALRFEPVDLIYAALIFEYVDVSLALATLMRTGRSSGTLAALLQLPTLGHPVISPSPFGSVAALAPLLRLVEPEHLAEAAEKTGFIGGESRTLTLPAGEQFSVQRF